MQHILSVWIFLLILKFIVRHLSVLKRLVALTFHIRISRVRLSFYQRKCVEKCYFMQLIFLRISSNYFETRILSLLTCNWMTNTWTASRWCTPAHTRAGCSQSPAAGCIGSLGGSCYAPDKSSYSDAIHDCLCLRVWPVWRCLYLGLCLPQGHIAPSSGLRAQWTRACGHQGRSHSRL